MRSWTREFCSSFSTSSITRSSFTAAVIQHNFQYRILRLNSINSNIPGNSVNPSLPNTPKLTPWEDQPPCPQPAVLVQTLRGIPSVRRETVKRPCPACSGTGKTVCGNCRGKGRVNYRSLAMLPRGVWPEWCPCCRASGRWHCERCMGTGVKRDPIGFRLGGESD